MPMNPLSHMLKVPSGMKPNNNVFGLISMANPSPAWEVSIQKAKARSAKVEKVSMTIRTKTKRARESIWVKVKALDPGQRSCFQCGERGHLSANCPNRDKRHGSPEKQSKGDKGKGDGKGKSKEKGKKGEKGDKGGKGKMKGKRATEFSQPGSEAGSEVWSEPDFEDGGRLSTCMEPSLPVEPFFMRQNLDDHDPHLWLVDSGASRTVVSAQALKVYRLLKERNMTTPINLRTASGEQVSIERECMLEVFFPTMIEHEDGEKVKVVRYEIRAVIGPVEHNLLSVHGLTRMGATFTFGPNSCSIQIADIRRMSCEIWANVPWVRAHRRRGKDCKGDVDMEAQVFEAWSDQSPSSQGGKSPSQSSISSPSIDTTYRTSSSAIAFFGTTSKSTHTGHAKVLQFDDEPEIHEFEPNTMSPKPSKLHESWPNALICAGSTSDDHPLPASGDVDEPMDPVPKEDHAPDSAQIQAAEPASYQQLSRKIEKELVLHRRFHSTAAVTIVFEVDLLFGIHDPIPVEVRLTTSCC